MAFNAVKSLQIYKLYPTSSESQVLTWHEMESKCDMVNFLISSYTVI
jgi:hypothetical protein